MSAWVKKGTTPRITLPNSKGKNISILAIMGASGIIHYSIKEGAFNKESFMKEVKILFNKVVTKTRSEKKYLVLDNCKIHSKEEMIVFG